MMRKATRNGEVFGIALVLVAMVFAATPMNVSAQESGGSAVQYNTLITSPSHVIEVDGDGNFVWSYPGDPGQVMLGYRANDAEALLNGNILVMESQMIKGGGYHRIAEVDREREIVWQITWEFVKSNCPKDGEILANGNFLITLGQIAGSVPLPGVGSVVEVDSNGNTVWSYPTGLNNPSDADRLANGNTLITDTDNHRVIEVDIDGDIMWSYSTGLNHPWDSERLSNGNTLITDKGNNRIVEIDITGNTV
ncbi:MAG: hypothetical protein KAW09_07045, partial [Thermoplasmata archaeon]|nr:hypothetical protein [Thermoplasmata archaeon]